MKTSRKILSLVLCLAMILSLCAVGAGAEGEADFAATVKNAETGGTVTLSADTVVSSLITLDKSLTIDLNGYKLSRADGNDVIQVINNATLTIDGKTSGSQFYGRIDVGISSNNNGNVILNGGTYSCANAQTVLHINGTCLKSDVTIKDAVITSPTDNGIQLNGAGTFLIEDSTITGATAVYVKSGTTTIRNSTLTGNMSPANYSYNGNGANATGDALVVDACNYPGGNPAVNIVSGSFSGTKSAVGYYQYNNGTAAISVTGGTFSADPTAYLASGYAARPLSKTSWEVVSKQAPKVYDGTTDTLTLTGAFSANGCDGAIWAKNGAQLTINGDGSVNGEQCPELDGFGMALWASGAATNVVINGGTYTNEASLNTDPHVDLIYASGAANIEINGGTFRADETTTKWTLNCKDNSGSVITVKGGTFYKFDPSHTEVAPAGTTEVVVPAGYIVVQNGDWYTVTGPVAKIGEAGYATLADAISAAQAGDTITLLKDVTTTAPLAIDKSLTLDGANHTITSTGAKRVMNVTSANVTFVLKDLTISGTGANCERGINVWDVDNNNAPITNVNLTLDNCTITDNEECNTGYGYYAINDGGSAGLNVTINHSAISGWTALNLWSTGANVTISNSTLNGCNSKTGDTQDFGVVVLEGNDSVHASNATVTLNDCLINTTITGSRTEYPILFNENSTGNQVIINNANKGTTVAAPAGTVIVQNHGTSNTVSITGGTFSSTDALKYLASGAKVNVKLAADETADATIPANTTVALDLNGHSITNTAKQVPAITNNGTLTVTGAGTIDNQARTDSSHYNLPAVLNNGTAFLNGGTFTRSLDAGTSANPASGDWYVLQNRGKMTIDGAAVVCKATDVSNMLNGWGHESQDSYTEGTANLTIQSGTFSGGIHTIKQAAAARGGGTLAIHGGTFTGATNADAAKADILTADNAVSVSGGQFNGALNARDGSKISISGGTFTGALNKAGTGTYAITGGTFSNLDGLAYISSGYTYTLGANAAVSAGETVTIPSGVTLVISAGKTLTNNGTIINAGILTNNGTFNNYGTLKGSAAEGGTAQDTAEVETTVKDVAAKADATAEEVKAAVAAVQDVPNTSLDDAATLDNLAKLETKLTAANKNISAEANLDNAPAAITAVAVQNAALSVPADVTEATKAVVTVAAAAETPSDAKDKAAAAVGSTIAEGATIIPLDISMDVGATPDVQPLAPLVIKLQVAMSKDQAAKTVIVHYLHDGGTEVIRPSVIVDDAKVFLQFTATSLSTFVAVETPVEINPNAYTFTLTPDKTNVNSGDTVTYTVTLKRTAGATENIKYFQLAFNYDTAVLNTPAFTPAANVNVTAGVYDTSNSYQLAESKAMPIGTEPVTLGTLSFKVAANADMAALDPCTVIGGQSGVYNEGYSDSASVDVIVGTASARLITLTFKGDTDTTLYEKYEIAGLYSDTACKTSASAPALAASAGYTLLDDTWKTAGGTAFDAATGYTSSMTFVRKQGQNHAISLPDTVTLVSGMRGTAGAYYVVEGQTEPVVFTVAAPDGMAVKAVTATIGSGTAQTLTAANNQYSIPASSLTGNLTVAVETEISLTTANVKSFISGDAFAPYCAYSGSDTLVLFKLALPADKQGVLLSGEGLPTVYALDAETEPYGDYNFAVLLPASTFSAVSNQAVTDYLQAKLIFTDSVNTTVTYDYNTNGKTGANVIDAGAAYDFSALQSGAAWHWAPTDDLLLKADVLNYTDSSYTLGTANANGTVDANDISVFLYTYAHFPKPVD